MIERILKKTVQKHLGGDKAIVIIGPRQVGKTTLLNSIVNEIGKEVLVLNCDEPDIRSLLTDKTSTELKSIIGTNKVVILDEAQRVKNIGLTLKLIVDQIKVHLIVSGSSALELANEINEPLTGRKFEFQMFPVSSQEMITHHGSIAEKRLLRHRLVYGMYPDVITNPGKENIILKNLTDNFLYKDIFTYRDIRKPEILEKVLQALSHQIGSEVSYKELGDLLSVDSLTITRYIDLLEKSMVIFRLPSFSRNLRNELKKSRKIYFYDNGVRNAVIANFQPAELRSDIGALLENYLISERVKFTNYASIWVNRFFWRTLQQQEIDYLEERDGKLYSFEFKWNTKKKFKPSLTFRKAYPESEFELITPDNYQKFVNH